MPLRKPRKIWGFSIKKPQIIGIIVALVVIVLSLIFLRDSEVLYFLLGISFVIAGLPFFVSLILESREARNKEEMFLEFARNLVESVKAGTPISKSIINIRNKDYGSLTPYIQKLANQISLGIPVKTALETFARDIKSKTITRAVTIISESEKAGGRIEDVLDSVAKSVAQIEKLRKERKASMYNLIVQGYIIFLIFIVIMLVMQFKILPIAAGLGGQIGTGETSAYGGDFGGLLGASGERATPEQLARPFLYLLIIQGFFIGLVIGKLSEGKIRAGLKHSFVLVLLAILIGTGAKLFIGG
jgi:flagellar protein FlaJ